MKRYITLAAFAISIVGLIGCNKNDSNQSASSDNRSAGQKTQDAISKAGEKTGEGIGKAVDSAANTAQSAAGKLKSATQPSADAAVKDTRQTLATAVEAAFTHDGLNDVVER